MRMTAVFRRVLAGVGLFGVGLAAALGTTGCGSGNVASQASTAIAGASVTRSLSVPTVTQTQPTATVTHQQTLTQQETVVQTVQQPVPPPPSTTAATQGSTSGTPTWVWVVVALAGAGLVALVVGWARGRRHRSQLSPEERQQRIFTAVTSWTTQGWVIENEVGDTAVLSRRGERMLVTVDANGRITTSAILNGDAGT
jgi:hypothetical protein